MIEILRRHRKRIIFASLCAISGVVVSVVMLYFGGPGARHLPGAQIHLPAAVGAGIAGWFCLFGFGRAGAVGWVAAFGTGFAMTVLGAFIGAGLLWQTRFFITGPFLGVLAVHDAMRSVPAVIIWLISMAGLHCAARRMRKHGLIPSIRPHRRS